ncbi:MAG: type II secretion system protein [Candidatus Margulisiibacteriota bacterium]|nr:type II secretion system GspH family protein [Candidatus Margulisiibacteriota bacterium]
MKKNGFTLIELSIALVILILITGSGILLLHKTVTGWEKVSENVQSIQLLQDITSRIVQDIQEAEHVLVDGDKLKLFFSDHDLTYDYKDCKVRRIKGSSASYLSIEGEISLLSFTQAPAGTILMTISSPKTMLEAAALCRN